MFSTLTRLSSATRERGIVNIDAIASVGPFDAGRLEVRMVDGSRVTTGRAGTRLLRQVMRACNTGSAMTPVPATESLELVKTSRAGA